MENLELKVRSEYEGKMEAKLREVGAKIDELMAKGESAKDQLHLKLEELKQKQSDLHKKLNEAKQAGKDAWHEFKPGLDKAGEELAKAVDELRQASERAASKLHR